MLQQPIVEMLIDGVWTDITIEVRIPDGITIKRGRSSEGRDTDPSTCELSVDNRNGQFSPRNPDGPYFGFIGRNTQLRVSDSGDGIRFVGEVSVWPQAWDRSGKESICQLEASGILRRLGKSKDVFESPIRRAILRLTDTPVAYWPLEDENDSTVGASAISSGQPMTVVSGAEPRWAEFTGIPGSKPILTMGGAAIRGPVPVYSSPTVYIRAVVNFPAAGSVDGAILLNAVTTGDAYHWRLLYETGLGLDGNFRLQAFDIDGVSLVDSSLVPPGTDLDGTSLRFSLELEQDGTDIRWRIEYLRVGDTVTAGTGSFIGPFTLGRVTHITLNSNLTLTDVSIGHVTVQATAEPLTDIADQLDGFSGETAGRRIERLCLEQNVAFSSVGDLDDTALLGPQGFASFLDLVRLCANTDLGLLYEPRDALGLEYRTRKSLYSQAPALALDYDALQIDQIEPVDDDQQTVNDVTVSREGGSSARAIAESGALSILEPPDGVGPYDVAITLPLLFDGDLPDQAAWRLHVGTVDEPRYPALGVELGSDAFLLDAPLTADAKAVDIGDRITMTNTPIWIPPEDLSQLVQGSTETITSALYKVVFNCQPESPWVVFVLDDPELGLIDTEPMVLGL